MKTENMPRITIDFDNEYERLAVISEPSSLDLLQLIAESFSIRLSELLHDAPPDPDVNNQWKHTAAGEKVGNRRQQKPTWFDDECRQAAIEKNDAYQATLKSAAIRAVYENYREKRREERHLFCRKRHEFVKAEYEEIQMHGSRNDARKFFQMKVSSLKLPSARTRMVIW